MVGIHKKGGGISKKVKKIRPKTYQAEKIIGNGSFGVVYKACYTEDGEHVAIKKVTQGHYVLLSVLAPTVAAVCVAAAVVVEFVLCLHVSLLQPCGNKAYPAGDPTPASTRPHQRTLCSRTLSFFLDLCVCG